MSVPRKRPHLSVRNLTPGRMPEQSRVSTPVELLAVAALLAVPVAVFPSGSDGVTLVSLWGLVNTGVLNAPGGVDLYPLWRYFADQPRAFGALPASIRAWPLAVGFHLLAAVSAGAGVAVGREDRRVTAGLLLLAATATLWVAAGLAGRIGVGTTAGWLSVMPIGALATLAVVVVAYRRDLRFAFDRA